MTECRCSRPTRDDATICDRCVEALTKALAEMPALVGELEVTLTQQKGKAGGNGSKSAETSLPFHAGASGVLESIRSLLVSWSLMLEEEGHGGLGHLGTCQALSGYLLARVEVLRMHPAGDDAHDELTDAAAAGWRCIDNPPPKKFLGGCEGQDAGDEDGEVVFTECPGEIWAREGKPVGACDWCGREYTVAVKRAEIEQRLDDMLCTTEELSSIMRHLGLMEKPETVHALIRRWHNHGRIPASMHGVDGTPMFRYGAVAPMLYAHYAEKVS